MNAAVQGIYVDSRRSANTRLCGRNKHENWRISQKHMRTVILRPCQKLFYENDIQKRVYSCFHNLNNHRHSDSSVEKTSKEQLRTLDT